MKLFEKHQQDSNAAQKDNISASPAKFYFDKQVTEVLVARSKSQYEKRANFEKDVAQADVTVEQWMSYIMFEIDENEPKRAKLLYERALAQSLANENHPCLWIAYVTFIQEHLKDTSLVRAKYEQRLRYSKTLPPKVRVELVVENGLYEEGQGNVARARKLFEQLDQEIAPGLVQAAYARINFEKRQGNTEMAR